jgi:hypothetical protein
MAVVKKKNPPSRDRGPEFLQEVYKSGKDYFFVVSAAGAAAAAVSTAGAAAAAVSTAAGAGAAVVSFTSSFFSPPLLQATSIPAMARIANTFFIVLFGFAFKNFSGVFSGAQK